MQHIDIDLMPSLRRQKQALFGHAVVWSRAIFLCLLLLFGGLFQTGHDVSVSAAPDLTIEQTTGSGHSRVGLDRHTIPGPAHCHTTGSCAAIVANVGFQTAPSPGVSTLWHLDAELLPASQSANSQYRPPRFFARV